MLRRYISWNDQLLAASFPRDAGLETMRASVQVAPFMPPVFGYKQVGQFDVWSYPALGSYLFAVFGLLLVAAFWLSWRRVKSTNQAPSNNGGRQ